MKTCTTCSVEKPFSEFHKGAKYADGYRTKCKSCMSAYYKARNSTPEKKTRARENHYQLKYGISPAEYDRMLAEQNGGCKICGSASSKRSGQRLMVDHCHSTGKVRGLLCNPCNAAIGLLGDNISHLQSAINYLNEHS